MGGGGYGSSLMVQLNVKFLNGNIIIENLFEDVELFLRWNSEDPQM